MEGKHLVITYTLTSNNQEIQPNALIDCGATGIALVYQDSPHHRQIPLPELIDRKQVEDINTRPIESVDITHIANVGIGIKDHKRQFRLIITQL
jgi:hypothetical protein